MAYIAPIHRPSSVRHALKLNFLAAEEECLVVAKSNRLEIYIQAADGLALKYTRAIYGKISMLQKMRPASSPTDHLFVGTDQYNYFTVSWDASTKQLRTEKSFVDLADKTGRDSQSADRCLVEPMRKHITLELYEGIITVIPVIQKSRKKGDPEIGTLGEAVSVRIPELFVRSSTFLHSRNPDAPKEKPKMLFLYEDNHKKPRLRLRSLDYMAGVSGEPGSAELDELPLAFDDIDPGASHLIPVPAPAHGVLILGETRITYLDEISEEPIIQSLEEATIFVAWEQIDGQRWLLADDFGRLYFLMLLLDGDVVAGWKLDYLGNTSRASCLVYLENGIVFIGSHQGDSQVIRIQEKSIEVVQVLSNIAPILDFTIMDMGSRAGDGQTSEYSSGQARIVTGSGAFQDGSLRSVRSGVGLEELGNLGDLGHVADLFALRSTADTEKSDVLVVSSIGETRIFTFNTDGEVEETEDFKGFALNESTLIAKNLAQNRILQVTGTSVRITELEGGMNTASWTSPNGQSILAASSNSRYLALSIGGVEIVILDLLADLGEVSRKTFDLGSQIACIEVPDIVDNICLVGFWQSTTILVLETETLKTVQSSLITEDEMAIPRSILLTQILPDHPPTLFVALADGNVVTFNFEISSYTLSSRKSTILGTQQANFTALPRGEGLFNVFATCEHPSLIYGSEGRIIYSAVTAEKASCICPFDCEAYPGAIAVASSEALKIALVDAERTTHVQTLPIGQTVRRIAYSTNLKAFGIGTIQRTLRGEVEIVQSHFKLADEVVFKELDSYDLNEDELVESVIRADLEEGSKQPVERFVVGTAYLDDERSDSIRGRLIVFEVTQDRKLKVVTELALLGACRALGVLDGNIVAALVKTVVIYAYEYGSLSKVASYRTSTAPIDLAITGSLIAIADLMKSVSIVQYKRGKAGERGTLTEVARHFLTVWGTAVAHVDDDTYLEADMEGNLMVLRQNVNGVTADDRRRLEVTSEMQLGEMVNRIRRINVPTSGNATVVPRAFMGTTEGSIYLFALIHPSKQDLLMRLQSAIATRVHSPGNIPFNKFRAFRIEVREAEEPYRFVDGELVEKFLDVNPELQEEIVEGLGVEVEEVRAMVEGLRHLH